MTVVCLATHYVKYKEVFFKLKKITAVMNAQPCCGIRPVIRMKSISSGMTKRK